MGNFLQGRREIEKEGKKEGRRSQFLGLLKDLVVKYRRTEKKKNLSSDKARG